MKNKIRIIGLSLFTMVLITESNAQPNVEKVNSKKVEKWYNKKGWLNGLNLQPHSSINKQEFARQYTANTSLWDKAFEFLRTHDLANLATGDYPLAGDSAYVKVTEVKDKDLENTQWESHKKYIDIQYVAKGKEKIGVTPVANATVTEPYNEAKDAAHYTAEGNYYVAEPGIFFIFFPSDAHRPNIKVNDDLVKKVVIKVRAEP
jgi:YhcH/YjgK/YiaL family protein